MIVIPAIDVRDGRCVRLLQGDYGRETVYGDDPALVARRWQDAGAGMLHVVDLDGARDGVPCQRETIASIVKSVDIPVQVGGGVRTREHAASLDETGVARFILGTAAVDDPELVSDLLDRYGPEKVVVGVDARDGLVATRGWLDQSDVRAVDLVDAMRERGVRRIIYTDIERDGTLGTPNYEAIAGVAGRGVRVVASGGVRTRDDLQQLATIPGVEAAIVGRALYTGDLVLDRGEWTIRVEPSSGESELS